MIYMYLYYIKISILLRIVRIGRIGRGFKKIVLGQSMSRTILVIQNK